MENKCCFFMLEAGGHETEISDVPALAAYLQLGRMDWKYTTEPQPGRACLGHTNQRCNWPRGKVVGGSSVLNYMLYVRGNRKDYDHWEDDGNPGWGYKEVRFLIISIIIIIIFFVFFYINLIILFRLFTISKSPRTIGIPTSLLPHITTLGDTSPSKRRHGVPLWPRHLLRPGLKWATKIGTGTENFKRVL